MQKEKKESNHVTVKIPKELIQEMDMLIGQRGFRSRGEIAKQAIRQLLDGYKSRDFEVVNHDERGVKIRDNKLGRYADVQITPKGIYCPLCDAHNCEHIRFALTQEDIRKFVIQKQKEGWKLPEV
jgi:Arc/MetJ-type ribon-helix-helix transcriptional regulator